MKTNIGKLGHKGFTLIELIITIVIIGILAAVAIPKFQSLSTDAEKGVASGVAAALASATSVNYAKFRLPNPVICDGTNAATCTYWPVATCGALAGAELAALADVPAGYTVGGGALTNDGVSGACVVNTPSGSAINFNAYGAF